MLRSVLVLLIAFGSTLLGSISGGSSSLLTTPSWLALGYPLPTAVAADKLAGTVWTVFGARNYLRNQSVDWKLVAGMAGAGIVGAFFGTRAATSLDPAALKRGVGGLILAAVALVALRPRIGAQSGAPRLGRPATAIASMPLGFYEGLLGSGNSILATMLISSARGLDLLAALGHYYLVAAAWCAAAAIAFAIHGVFDLRLAIPAALGATLGGYLGSRIGSRRGVGFVRVLFLLAGVILGAKLLLGW